MSSSHRLALATGIFVLAGVAAPAAAQARYDFPGGRVEVLGLRRWTLQMLQDSIRKYVPGQSLHDAACMVTLRDSLHFAEASVTTYMLAPPGAPRRDFLSITLVEPEDRARVVWDERPRNEFTSMLPDYAGIILPVTDSVGGLWQRRLRPWHEAYFFEPTRRARRLADAPAAARADAERLWSFLEARRAEPHRQLATKTLRNDGFYVNRLVAAMVLSNFPANDSTWWVLTRALRDPREQVRGTASVALSTLPDRTVDWRPAVADLRLLLGGTNLPAQREVIDLLVRTKVDPSLAAPLLRDNGDWVLAHLGSEAPGASTSAHSLLIRLNGGTDLGRARAPWAEWIARLR
jgi:hypothetical protein